LAQFITTKNTTIICTGYSETMDVQKAREQGIDAFLMKPVDVMDAARTIRQILDTAVIPPS
jgi:CheY-like chemotaxis protein